MLLYFLKLYFYFFLSFWGLHPRHMEVPSLGSNQSCGCKPMPQPQQHQIQAVSVIYTTAHGNARSLAHWTKTRDWTNNVMVPSQICFHCVMMGTPIYLFLLIFVYYLSLTLCHDSSKFYPYTNHLWLKTVYVFLWILFF